MPCSTLFVYFRLNILIWENFLNLSTLAPHSVHVVVVWAFLMWSLSCSFVNILLQHSHSWYTAVLQKPKMMEIQQNVMFADKFWSYLRTRVIFLIFADLFHIIEDIFIKWRLQLSHLSGLLQTSSPGFLQAWSTAVWILSWCSCSSSCRSQVCYIWNDFVC